MDFDLTQEQKMIRDTVRKIARAEFAKKAASIDENETPPLDNAEILAQNGLFGVFLPEALGGVGEGFVTFALVMEEVAKCCATTSMLLATQALPMMILLFGADDSQKEQWLRPMAQGKVLTGMAATEPGAGSDLCSIITTAVRKGDRYLINGRKVFVSNGGIAHHILVLVNTDRSAGAKGLTFFLVDRNTPGLVAGRKERKMGLRGSDTREIIFEDCDISVKNRIGREGSGLSLLIQGFNYSRPGVGAQAVGIAQGALDLSLHYTKERVQFNVPISSFQGIQWMLAEMALQIEASRGMVFRACALLDRDPSHPEIPALSSMAKWIASDTAMKVTTDAVQLLGGYGYCRDYPAERMMRDAKITQIYEGTNQIQRELVAKYLFRSI